MASDETWPLSELEKGILLSETVENGIITRTYISPLLEPPVEENHDPLVLTKEYPMPYFCPYCGNGIGSAGAFTMHIRACKRRLPAVFEEEELPAKPLPECRSCNVEFESEQAYVGHLKLKESEPDVQPWSTPTLRNFRCIFCHQEFVVRFGLGQMRRRYACDACGQKARAEEADRQKKPKVPKKTHSCPLCGKQYKLEGFLVRHQVVCQGFTVKRKREYEIHDVNKKKREDESHEVAEAMLVDEILEVAGVKLKDEILKVPVKRKRKYEIHGVTKKQKSEDVKRKREYKIHEVTKKKREDESHEVAEVMLEDEILEVAEVKLEDEILEFPVKRNREYEIHEASKKQKREDESHEVTEVMLADESHEVAEVILADESHEVAEVILADESHEVAEVILADESHEVAEVKLEDEILEITKMKLEDECQ